MSDQMKDKKFLYYCNFFFFAKINTGGKQDMRKSLTCLGIFG